MNEYSAEVVLDNGLRVSLIVEARNKDAAYKKAMKVVEESLKDVKKNGLKPEYVDHCDLL